MHWEEFLKAVQEKLSPFQGMITYGNLALVYETPGGSTNQLSVYYRPSTDRFEALGQEQEEDLHTSSIEEVINWLEDKVKRIPQIRLAKLKSNIDQWFASGRKSGCHP